jgi:hypothetical protein
MTEDPKKEKTYYHRRPPRIDRGGGSSPTARDRPEPQRPGPPQGETGDGGSRPVRVPHELRQAPTTERQQPPVGQPPGVASGAARIRQAREGGPPPAPTGKDPAGDGTPSEPTTRFHWIALGVIVVLGVLVRLKDPLSSVVIGAEDPYLHMERTWNLLQGNGVRDYPVGYMVLLAPLTVFGPEGFYAAVRFLPPLLGAVAIGGTFLFARSYIHPTAALAAAGVIAAMPEHMMRTNILFPTAFDLAVLPFLLWHVIRLTEGDKKSAWWAAGLGLFLLMIHPWFVGMAVIPLGAFALTTVIMRSENAARFGAATAGAIFAVFLVLSMLPVWKPTDMLFERALPKFFEIVRQPSTMAHLPDHVDYATMLTWPVIIIGLIGAAAAFRRRDRFSLLALSWVLLLFPITLVDWFGIWYIPHRTVVFMAVGVAMLAGIAVAEGIRYLKTTTMDETAVRIVAIGAVALLLLVTVPVAAATPGWYRLYDEDDYAAWDELEARDTPFVVTGSWEARAGYRALTANEASYNPAFFNDESARNAVLSQHPDLVVLVDPHATDVNKDFLQGWRVVGRWGDVTAYANQ